MSFTFARRDLALVVTAKSVSLLGDELAAFALLLRLQSHGAGPAAVAALLTAALVPIVVLAPLVGRVVDGHDSRMLLVVSSLSQAALCAVLTVQTSTPAILALVAGLGVGQAVNGATWQALLPAIAGPDALPRAIGLNQAAGTIASIAAPVLAGLLVGRYGSQVPLVVDTATFLAITVAALLVTTRHGLAVATPGEAPRGGLRIMRDDPLLRLLLAMLALFVLLGSMVNVVEVFLVRVTLHASTTWYGISGAALAVGLLAGALVSSRMRGTATMGRAFVGAAAVLAAALAVTAAVPNVYWMLPAAFAIGAANGVLNVALGSMVMGRTPAAVRGRVSATVGAVAYGAQILAFLVAGSIALALTPREIFLLSGILGLCAPLLFGRSLIRAAASRPAADAADSATVVEEGVAA
jgi:MFS family permease